MATTTNFGWETPDDTDLVKDGALAMRTLGNAIDTSLVDLKGGTTGQVLSKTSNTDMDFTWVTSAGDIEGVTAGTGISGGGTSGTVTITNSMATAIDAKGDLIAGTGADAFARLAVGTNGQYLVADSTQTTGLKWATPSTGAMSYITGASFSGVSSFSLPNSTFTSTYDNYFLMVNVTDASATTNLNIRMRTGGSDDSNTNYNYRYGITDTSGSQNYDGGTGTSAIVIAGTTTTDDRLAYPLYIFSPYLTASTKIMGTWWGSYGGNNGAVFGGGVQHTATSYDALSVFVSSGTFQGNYKLYGIANS
jgi:hypothetical protein